MPEKNEGRREAAEYIETHHPHGADVLIRIIWKRRQDLGGMSH